MHKIKRKRNTHSLHINSQAAIRNELLAEVGIAEPEVAGNRVDKGKLNFIFNLMLQLPTYLHQRRKGDGMKREPRVDLPAMK